MLALAALLGVVTVEIAPTPLPQALAVLSKAMGRPLASAPALDDEILLARLKDADPERVLREVAFSLDARWEPEGERLILRRDPAAAQKAEAEARRGRATMVADSLKEIAGNLAKQPRAFPKTQAVRYRKLLDDFRRAKRSVDDSDDVERLLDAANGDDFDANLTPGWRALARIVAALGPRPFLALREGERVVWSDRPTPMQASLGPVAQSALAAFRTEYALVDPKTSVVRFRLVAQNGGPNRPFVSLRFAALDANGAAVEEAEESLNGGGTGSDDADVEAPKRTAPTPESPLKLPEEATEYFAVVNARRKSVRDEAFRRWEPRLADPVANEPTRPYAGEAFLAAAKAQDRNLVGSLSDGCGARFGPEFATLGPRAFLKESEGAWTLRDGWIVLKPTDGLHRISRAEGRGFLRHAVRQGGLDVDSTADWLIRRPDDIASASWLALAFEALISGSGPNSALATFDADDLRLWGLFGPAVRRALRDGAPVPFAALSPGAIAELRKRIFWGDALEGGPEVTDVLPTGLPNGIVTLKIEEAPVYVAWSSNQGEPVYRAPVDAARYGLQLGQSERRGQPRAFDRFRPGSTRRYTLTFALGPGLSFDQTMGETFLDLDSPPLERLPEGFLRSADAARKEFLSRPVPTPSRALPNSP